MKKCILILVTSVCLQLIQAQNNKYEFGKISNNDIQYNECPYDKTAEAVVLFDKGESRFVRTDNSFMVVYERTTRIKILTNAGIDWAKVEIPIYRSNNIYEKIIVKNYWIDEPFHSSFVKILYCISENDFWIKSLKSQGAWYL